jgi:cytochrome P450
MTTTSNQLRMPPGPSEPYNSADDLFEWMNENYTRYGDIYRASVLGSDVYVVSAPEYCDRILRANWQNYPRKGLVVKRISLTLGKSLIGSNGEFWSSQRRMIQPAFTKSAVSDLIDVITSANFELLAAWKRAAMRAETVNVTQDVSLMVLKVTLTSIFGDDYEAVAPSFRIFAQESARNFEFGTTVRTLGNLILQVTEQRRREGRESLDILGRLMKARDREHGQPMPDDQLAREIMTLVVAGHETTASLLNWMWFLLARHPQIYTRLAEEFARLPWGKSPSVAALPQYTYTRQVIDEALRLYPPLWLMTRRALNDDRFGEFLVPARTEIYISPYLIQRSPQLWETPDRFDPDRLKPENEGERHELALCPFGAGPRNCIGEFFARVEIQVHLMMMARELCLRYDEPGLPEITTGLNLLSKHDFDMVPQMRAMAAAEG